MKRSHWTAAILVLVVAAAGWMVYQAGCSSGDSTAGDSDGQASLRQRDVGGLGRLEPEGGIIDVGALVGERLDRLVVHEGSRVSEGQPLACLGSRELRKLQFEAAEKQLAEAVARRKAELRVADQRIELAELDVRKAENQKLNLAVEQRKIDVFKSNLTLARRDLARLQSLDRDLVSDQEGERQRLVVEKTEAELKAAEATLDQAQRASRLARSAAETQLAAARAARDLACESIPVDSLGSARDLAEIQYDRTEITAPCDGTVLEVFMRPGELVTGSPILQMANLERMVAVVEVHENDVRRVSVNQAAVVRSQAFKAPQDRTGFSGKVVAIGQTVGTPKLRSVDPFAPADRHVVEVRVELDAEASRQVAAFVNMQVEVTFLGAKQARSSAQWDDADAPAR